MSPDHQERVQDTKVDPSQLGNQEKPAIEPAQDMFAKEELKSQPEDEHKDIRQHAQDVRDDENHSSPPSACRRADCMQVLSVSKSPPGGVVSECVKAEDAVKVEHEGV